MEQNQMNNDEIEIDLLELFYALRHRWWAILLALVIGAGAAGVYTKKLIAPHYQSTSMVYLLSKETTLASLADLQIGSQLTKDYSVIIKSRPVLIQVMLTPISNISSKAIIVGSSLPVSFINPV